MITIHFLSQNQQVHQQEFTPGDALPPGTLWIDLLSPSQGEELAITSVTGIKIPSREQIWKNETLNRFYEENGTHYMTAAVITKVGTPYPATSAITFICTPNYLLTLRYVAPTSFANFALRLARFPHKFSSGPRVLEGLLEEVISRVAYNSEHVVNRLDELSHVIFGRANVGEKEKPTTTSMMKQMLKDLGNAADLNSKINESLHSLSRLVLYVSQVNAEKELNKALRTLTNDVQALMKQTAFLSDKITFLLDATLGMINAEQNLIIKLFSMVTVFLMPPTLIGSIYGMNFAHMPELNWALGYPAALLLMVICAIFPYVYFRRKGWL